MSAPDLKGEDYYLVGKDSRVGNAEKVLSCGLCNAREVGKSGSREEVRSRRVRVQAQVQVRKRVRELEEDRYVIEVGCGECIAQLVACSL